MSLEYTVYKCLNKNNDQNVMYNLYKHDLGGDFYIATFRYLDDLKKFVTTLDIQDDEIYYSNILKKTEEDI